MSYNIAKYIARGEGHPAHISIDECADLVKITVHSAGAPDGSGSSVADITISREMFGRLLAESTGWFTNAGRR